MINLERTYLLIGGTTYKIEGRSRTPALSLCQHSPSQYKLPCDVITRGGIFYALRPGQEPTCAPDPQHQVSPEDPLDRYLNELPTGMEEKELLKKLAEEGDLHLASDGSAKDGDRSTFSVCISSTDMTTLHISAHEANGIPHDSGRAELYGLLVLVCYTSDLLSALPDISLNLYCDNLEAVNYALDPYLGKTPSWADVRNIDLKMRLAEVLNCSRVIYRFKHVKSHQDEKIPYEELSLPAKLNYQCDRAAKDHLLQLRGPSPNRAPAEGNSTYLADADGRITNSFVVEILERKYSRVVREHLGIDEETFQWIDWPAHAKAVKSLESPSLTKLIWGQNPSRQKLHLMGKHPSPMCPLCEEADIPFHFISCSHLNSHPMVLAALEVEQTVATKLKIPDHFIKEVREALTGICKSANNKPQHLREVYREQAILGRQNFIKGRLIRAWGETKPSSESRMTPGDWVRRLAKHVLKALLKKWEIRCKVVSEAKDTLEKRRLVNEAEKLWKNRKTLPLLAQDRYLFEDRNKPISKRSAEELRNWIKTRYLAVDAARETLSRRNSTLHAWLRA